MAYIVSCKLQGENKPTGISLHNLLKSLKIWGNGTTEEFSLAGELQNLQFLLSELPGTASGKQYCGYHCNKIIGKWATDLSKFASLDEVIYNSAIAPKEFCCKVVFRKNEGLYLAVYFTAFWTFDSQPSPVKNNYIAYMQLQGRAKPKRNKLAFIRNTLKKWCKSVHGLQNLQSEIGALEAELVDLNTDESTGLIKAEGVYCTHLQCQYANEIADFKEKHVPFPKDDEFCCKFGYKKKEGLYICISFLASWSTDDDYHF